jgi:hypothetical protein
MPSPALLPPPFNSDQICIPKQTAYSYLAIIIGTLLFIGILEWLNGKRIAILMAMLEEVVWNLNANGVDERDGRDERDDL